ncbi:MAG: hypothetical protein M1830_007970 [Pleopsidium flavum]|nr:MAG: hypothetical protein M1830_007970 [Pleopsidium flavum]
MAAERNMPAAKAQAARLVRVAEERAAFHESMMANMAANRDREEKRTLEALNSPRLDNFTVAKVCLKSIMEKENLDEGYTVHQLQGGTFVIPGQAVEHQTTLQFVQTDKRRSSSLGISMSLSSTRKLGFLNLPAEIRNQIYQLALSTRRGTREYGFQPAIRFGLQINLLSTCHQFHQEASDILYRENTFIHVLTRYRGFVDELITNGIPLVARDAAARFFPSRSLRIILSFSGIPPYSEIHLIIAKEDLPAFCMVLWQVDLRWWTPQYALSLELQVLPQSGDQCLSEESQQLLLDPFKTLTAVSQVSISGPVAPALAQEVETAMVTTVPEYTEEMLQRAMTVEREGRKALRSRQYFLSAAKCSNLLALCSAIARSDDVRAECRSAPNVDKPYWSANTNLLLLANANLGRLYSMMGRWEKTYDRTNTAIEIGTNTARIRADNAYLALLYHIRACAHSHLHGHEKAAILDLEKALELRPESIRISNALRHAKLRAGSKRSEARSALEAH